MIKVAAFSRTTVLLLAVFALVGCSSSRYTLEGRAVESTSTGARFVTQEERDPAMLPGAGVPGVLVEVIRNPRTLNRKVVATGKTDSIGVFNIDIDAFGAGWMKEEWLFRCTHPRRAVVEYFDSLPAKDSTRVLEVDMGRLGPPGSGGRQLDEDERIQRELERFGR